LIINIIYGFDITTHTLICIHHTEHDTFNVTYYEETNSLHLRREVAFTDHVNILPIKGTIVETAYHQYEDHGWSSKSSARLFAESVNKLKVDKIIYVNLNEYNHIDVLSVNESNIAKIVAAKSNFWLGGLVYVNKQNDTTSNITLSQ
jgi:hypothetical protein